MLDINKGSPPGFRVSLERVHYLFEILLFPLQLFTRSLKKLEIFRIISLHLFLRCRYEDRDVQDQQVVPSPPKLKEAFWLAFDTSES